MNDATRRELKDRRTGKKKAILGGSYWSNESRTLLRTLYYQGYGFSEMALMMERTEVALFEQAKAMGLISPAGKKRSKKKKYHEEN